MKGKPISIRFDENDLAIAINLSGVKKPQKLVDLLIAEYVKPLKPKPIELPKDYMKVQNIKVLNPDGTVDKIKIMTPTAAAHDQIVGTLGNDAIMEQIKAIQNETIPKERDTLYGRKSWEQDRQSRISLLKAQLKYP